MPLAAARRFRYFVAGNHCSSPSVSDSNDVDQATRDQQVTELLRDWQKGDDAALTELLPILYADLRKLAGGYMRRERADHTLQPTALVSEAYLKLDARRDVPIESRAHFMAAAAEAMRRILVDHARRKRSEKRGGDRQRVTLYENVARSEGVNVDLLTLDQALERLEQLDEALADVVKLRYFGGLNIDDIASVLNSSPRSVSRSWTMARAWLKRELASIGADEGAGA